MKKKEIPHRPLRRFYRNLRLCLSRFRISDIKPLKTKNLFEEIETNTAKKKKIKVNFMMLKRNGK